MLTRRSEGTMSHPVIRGGLALVFLQQGIKGGGRGWVVAAPND